jgi:hypothetical protein
LNFPLWFISWNGEEWKSNQKCLKGNGRRTKINSENIIQWLEWETKLWHNDNGTVGRNYHVYGRHYCLKKKNGRNFCISEAAWWNQNVFGWNGTIRWKGKWQGKSRFMCTMLVSMKINEPNFSWYYPSLIDFSWFELLEELVKAGSSHHMEKRYILKKQVP